MSTGSDEAKAVFSDIYFKNTWVNGSGVGSDIKYAAPYVKFLVSFLRENFIGSVLDMGCGDWQFSRYIDWGQASYLGIDPVPTVINRNRRLFAKKGIEFLACSAADIDLKTSFDLLIIKDVLQHLPLEQVHSFLRRLINSNCKYCLITNCVHHIPSLNAEIELGDFRPLDITLPPFNFKCQEVLSFDRKKTFLWTNPAEVSILGEMNPLNMAIERLRTAGATKIALYGAGQHSRKILPLLESSGINVAVVFDDNPKGEVFEGGIPVAKPASAAHFKNEISLVLLSSDCFEKELAGKTEVFEKAGIQPMRIYT